MDLCNTSKSYSANVKIIEKYLFHGHWTSNNCTQCQRQCYQDIYIAYTEMTQMKPSDNQLCKLRVFYQVNRVSYRYFIQL